MSDVYLLIIILVFAVFNGIFIVWASRGEYKYHKHSHDERAFIIDMLNQIKNKLDTKL